MILRKKLKRDFTVVSNAAIRDDRLSFRAVGLLTYLCSLPDGAAIDSLSLSKRKKEGRDAIRTAFTELVDAAYVVRRKEQDPNGQWRTVVEVTDTPESGFQASGDRELETRRSAGQALKTQETDTNPPKPPLRGGDDDVEFDRFWQAYPRKAGKGQARRAWRRAVKKVPGDELVTFAEQFARDVVLVVEPQFVPHPATWLNGERWEDEPEIVPQAEQRGIPTVRERGMPIVCGLCDDTGWKLTGDEASRCDHRPADDALP